MIVGVTPITTVTSSAVNYRSDLNIILFKNIKIRTTLPNQNRLHGNQRKSITPTPKTHRFIPHDKEKAKAEIIYNFITPSRHSSVLGHCSVFCFRLRWRLSLLAAGVCEGVLDCVGVWNWRWSLNSALLAICTPITTVTMAIANH